MFKCSDANLKDGIFDDSPAAPAPVQPVVDWTVHQAGVDAVQEALDEADREEGISGDELLEKLRKYD